MATTRPLHGKVCLAAGATRGGGRGVAVALGEAGATVYCTGRSGDGAHAPAPPAASPFALAGRRETIEDTAARVDAAGGHGIAVRCDHTRVADVEALVARIRADHGHLDVVVDSVWGGDELAQWGTPFWELDLARVAPMIERAVTSHVVTARLTTPLLLDRDALIVQVTDGDALYYRGNLVYDLVKIAVARLAFAMAEELHDRRVAAVAITPGFLRSEAMLDHFGVTEATWRDGAAQDPHFAFSESPAYLGRAVAALAADPDVMGRSGGLYATWTLQERYGFTDADGSTPHWGRHMADSDFGRDHAASARRFVDGFTGPR